MCRVQPACHALSASHLSQGTSDSADDHDHLPRSGL